MYESDLTKFMRDYLERHPEALEAQATGRAAWWDRDPARRAAPPPARNAPRAGGAEYTFEPIEKP